MKNKYFIIMMCMMLVILLAACGKATGAQNNKEISEEVAISEVESQMTQSQTSESKSTGILAALVGCGEIYKDQELDYNVIGVRKRAYDDGVKHLILKLEVYNHSSGDVNFTPMDRLTVYNSKDEECALDLFADVASSLSGNIVPESKIKGEVAFEITDTEDTLYSLHVGKMFEYSPAIQIEASDMDKTFDELFENSNSQSPYAIGVPVESEQLTILLNSASVIERDKPDQDILLIDVSVTNHDSEAMNFMGGINLNGVYTAEGEQLESAVKEWTFPNYAVESGATNSGILSYYISDDSKNFYMTVTPNMDEFSKKATITINVD